MRRLVTALAAGVLLAGCYHATVETGLAPSAQTVEKPWAMSFIYGLVPPPLVETMAKCPNGVSKVDTQMSFVNGLVNALTFGIVTPMDIRVVCAERRSASAPTVEGPATAETLQRAVDLARSSDATVQVVVH